MAARRLLEVLCWGPHVGVALEAALAEVHFGGAAPEDGPQEVSARLEELRRRWVGSALLRAVRRSSAAGAADALRVVGVAGAVAVLCCPSGSGRACWASAVVALDGVLA